MFRQVFTKQLEQLLQWYGQFISEVDKDDGGMFSLNGQDFRTAPEPGNVTAIYLFCCSPHIKSTVQNMGH